MFYGPSVLGLWERTRLSRTFGLRKVQECIARLNYSNQRAGGNLHAFKGLVGGTAGLPQIWGWGKLFGFDGDRPYCLTCVVSVRSGAFWNYLCCRLKEIVFPVHDASSEVPDLTLAEFTSRALLATTLGHGRADLSKKFGNLAHSIAIETPDLQGALDSWRFSVRSLCSDLGTERKIADVPSAMTFQLSDLQQLIDELRTWKKDAFSESDLKSYFFPNAIFVPSMMHLLWNGFEETLKSLPSWEPFEDDLRIIIKFLADRGLREMFTHYCLNGQPAHVKSLFKDFSKQHLTWRWEHMEKLQNSLYNRLDEIKKLYSLERMRTDLDKTAAQVDKSLIGDVDKVICNIAIS